MTPGINFGMFHTRGLLPTINGTISKATSASAVSHTVTLPASIVAGELLLICFASNNTRVHTYSGGGGYTKLVNGEGTDPNSPSISIAYKIAAGGDANPSVGLGTANGATYMAMRIGNFMGTPEAAFAGDTAVSGQPNPPNLVPSWLLKRTLMMAFGVIRNTSSVSSPPSLYTNLSSQVGTSPGIGAATRETNSGAENPGTFTFGTPDTAWSAATVAIRGNLT